MSSFHFDTTAYLKRLNVQCEIAPTEQGLRTLHQAQLHSIPFETFDLQLGRAILLEPGSIYDKLVCHQRGGYCFELNGLFLMALKAFGFDARPLLARVQFAGELTGRGHQLSLISFEDRLWLSDVGFGKDNPRGPIMLEHDTVQHVSGQAVRLIDGGNFGTMLQVFIKNTWENLYSFDMEYVFQPDIDYGNHFMSTHPSSFFACKRIAVKPSANGTAVLLNHRLTLTTKEEETFIELPPGQAYLDALKKYFNIELGAPYSALKPLV